MAEEFSPKKKKRGKLLLRIGITILALLLIIISAIGIILNTVLTPEKITPIVLNLARDYVNAEVKCESIDITFFSTFPDLGVKLQNGSITHTPQNDSADVKTGTPQDSLLAFGNFTVAINPVAFLFNKQVIIHQLEINDANIYAYVDETGKANWDIFKSSTEVEEEQAAFEMPELNIKNIRFQNINLVYDDMQEDMFVMIDSLRMRLSGNMSKERAGLNLGARTKGITTYYQGQSFSKELPVSIRTTIKTDRAEKSITLEKGNIYLGILQFKTNGYLKKSEDEEKTADIDMDFTLDVSSMKDLLKIIPEHISALPPKLTAEGKISSTGKITGKISKEILPQINLSAQLTDGSLGAVKYPNKPLIETFNFDFNTSLNLSGKEPSLLNLNNLFIQTASSKLTLKGKVNDLLNNPRIDAQAQANINFTQLAQKLSFLEDMEMKGLVDFDLAAKCNLNDILSSNYGKINANGTANIKQLEFKHLKEDILVYASNADIKLGSNTQDSIRGTLRESLLRGYISLDSLNINLQNNIKTNIGRLSASFSTTEPADSSSIAPLLTGARARNLIFTMGDSIKTQVIQTTASIRLQPQKNRPALPEINARLSVDTLRGRVLTMGGRISNAKVNLKLSKQQERQRRVRQATNNSDSLSQINRSDTTRRVFQRNTLTRAQRDSLRQIQLNPQTNISFRLESDKTRDFLRKWNLSGESTCDYISVRTPIFPLPLRMKDSDFAFSTDTLSLNNADITIGSSSLSLKGEVNGIRRALLYNNKVTAKLSFSADSIDFNQLIKAAVAGSEYSQKSSMERDTISRIVMDESNDNIVQASVDTTSSGIFVIPRNLDIEFRARIKKGKFNHINIKNTQGRIILRNQAVQLPNFRLNTDIGSANIALVYKAPNIQGAHLGLELNVNQIDVKQLISTFPMLNELTPMLRSFEGVVDCDMTAVTELDSLMNVELPHTTASCFLKGKDLVLLDGETFSEISKTLMFKNKNRNLIDSVSVEMILENEKLMIFPFQVSMDRYLAGVGGTQNLDMSFDYHITVLKSPLPFKLGLNISGTPDKMKIRLAKAKYKDLFTVAKQENLDNAVINLRKEMDDRIRKNINDIVGTEQFRRNRNILTLPDSIRQLYFKMDTTAISVEEMDTTKISF